MNNISINQDQLNEYLIDFHPKMREELLKIIEKEDFNRGPKSFISSVKRIASMPKIGKNTIRYWTSRGWSIEESKIKRRVIKRDPSKSPMNIEFWMGRGLTKEQAEFEVKSQRKLNREYWIKRGFSIDESIEKCSEFQRSNSQKYLKKLESDTNFKKIIDLKRNTNIDYWINLGYNEEDSKKKVAERQSTFSLKKCIDKYGDDLGLEIWNKRQEKWKKSLLNSTYNMRDGKDSNSIQHYKIKYGENWIEKYIIKQFNEKNDIRYLISFENYQSMILDLINSNLKLGDIHYIIKYAIIPEVYSCTLDDMYSFLIQNYEYDYMRPSYYKRMYGENWVNEYIKKNTYKNKEEVKFLLSFESHKDLVDYLIDNYSITNAVLRLQNVIISSYYGTTYEEIFKYLMDSDPYISGKFGHMRYFNGHLCRSSGEFEIAKFLKDNNISYHYEKKYPNSSKRCDFYLLDKDFYIEYLGMISVSNANDNYIKKEFFCIENNINHIFSSKIEEIKSKIIKIYEI